MSKTLSGLGTGMCWRYILSLNNKDLDGDNHVIVLPCEATSIHSSFFIGLFAESIKHLGEEVFRSKYHFRNIEKHIRSFELAITEAQINKKVEK